MHKANENRFQCHLHDELPGTAGKVINDNTVSNRAC